MLLFIQKIYAVDIPLLRTMDSLSSDFAHGENHGEHQFVNSAQKFTFLHQIPDVIVSSRSLRMVQMEYV